jgi:hypothetical protein
MTWRRLEEVPLGSKLLQRERNSERARARARAREREVAGAGAGRKREFIGDVYEISGKDWGFK